MIYSIWRLRVFWFFNFAFAFHLASPPFVFKKSSFFAFKSALKSQSLSLYEGIVGDFKADFKSLKCGFIRY